MSPRTTNIGLIRQCHEIAKSQIKSDEAKAFSMRKSNTNNEFLLSEIQTPFQAAAYVAYLTGQFGLVELKTCLYFDKPSLESMFFSMIMTQPDAVTLNNIKNMTKQRLTDKSLNNIVEFCHEYKARKNNKGVTH